MEIQNNLVELNEQELQNVNGGLSFTEGGLAIIGLGFAGGPATAAFGLLVGGACLYVGYYQDQAR
jgi:bacteriocin-like protein